HDPFTSLAFEQPAIRFLLGMAETVHIEGLVYDGLDCQGEPGLAMGDLALVAPRPTVFLNFDPPLPPGTNLSIKGTIGGCAQGQCINYTIGPDVMAQPNLCTRVPTVQ